MEWRTIDERPNYEVSDTGLVRRRVGTFRGLRRILKPRIRVGYEMVCLSDGGVHVWRYVHRLVALAFLGKPPAQHQTNHKNRNRQDNRVENLEWVTASENVQHGFDNGGYRCRGEDCAPAKLTNAAVYEIRGLAKRGHTQQALADRFGVSRSTIGRVVTRQGWTHLPPDEEG